MFQLAKLALSVRALGQVGASLSLSTARPILLSGNAVSPGVVTGKCGPMGVSGTARNEPLAARTSQHLPHGRQDRGACAGLAH